MKSDWSSMISAGWATPLAVIVAGATLAFNVFVVRFLPQGDVTLFVSFFAFSNLLAFSFSGFQVSLTRNIGFSSTTARDSKFDRFSADFLILGFGLMAGILLTAFIWNSALGVSLVTVVTIALSPMWLALLGIVGGRLSSKGRFAMAGVIGLANILGNLGIQFAVFSLGEFSVEKVLVVHTLVNLAVGSVAVMWIRSDVVTSSMFRPDNLRVALVALIYAFIVQFDLLFSGLVLPVGEREHYAVAAGMTKPALLLAGIFYLAVFRILIRRVRSGESIVSLEKKAIWGSFVGGLLFAIGGVVFGPSLLIVLYGDGWRLAAELVPALAVAIVPFFVAGVMFQSVLVIPSRLDMLVLAMIGILAFALAFGLVTSPGHLVIVWFLSGVSLLLYFLVRRRRGRKREILHLPS